tara:strand:- start:265 stop:606 length:342 start_codon:yes stop_codon:yes gene_type:complete
MSNKAVLKYQNSTGLEDRELPIKIISMPKEAENINKTSRASKLLKGAKGIAKSTLGIDIAGKDTIKIRRQICEDCDKRKDKRCGACGCYIVHKTRLASESCPNGYWVAEDNEL